jgi:hypothetical protein
MHESYYVAFNYFLFYRLGIGELRVMSGGGEGPYEIPPSRGWPCSVEDKLFFKPKESHSFLYHHDLRCHHCCHSIASTKFR